MTIGNKGVGLRGACSLRERACRGFRLPAGCGLGFAARTGLREGFVRRLAVGMHSAGFARLALGSLRERAMSRFRSPAGCGLGVRCENGAMSRFRSPAGSGYALSGFRPPGPGFAARTGYEQVSFAGWQRQFQFRRCRRPTRGRQSPRPLDPRLRPASPPLRGPFASSGFLTDRRDAPSLARPRLFATSLSLVRKSLIGSALQMASLTPRCDFFFSLFGASSL